MEQKQLKRDLEQAALSRMEDAARTIEDFRTVTKEWDRLDKNRRRRERRNEVRRPNEMMLHWDKLDENDIKGKLKSGLDVAIPRPLEHEWWRQQIRGDFIDTIFDCPHELHELVSGKAFSRLLQELSDSQKEILYYSAIRQYSNVRIAALRNQSDRNIRKTLTHIRENLRNALDNGRGL